MVPALLLSLGMTVARNIPVETVVGLATGRYKMFGGVIRWASGTSQAGQIVRHLILPVTTQVIAAPLFAPIASIFGAGNAMFGTINAYQLHQLSGTVNQLQGSVNGLTTTAQAIASNVNALTASTQQVLQIATGTMMLSGLNLAVSAVGFATLNQKLNNIDQRLKEIQKDIKDIKEIQNFLQLKQRAELAAVMRDLLNIENISHSSHRDAILLNAKSVLAPISLQYGELLTQANSLEAAMVAEEYFCMIALAHARCMAELGIGTSKELQETKKFWQEHAKHIAKNFILGKYPERFLFSDFAADVPISVLIEWLDFVYGEEKGYGWIDELRSKTKRWYGEPDGLAQMVRGAGQIAKILSKETEMDKERNVFIPSMYKLVARNNVLEGHINQYEMLESRKIIPSEFERQITQLRTQSAVGGHIILENKALWYNQSLAS